MKQQITLEIFLREQQFNP